MKFVRIAFLVFLFSFSGVATHAQNRVNDSLWKAYTNPALHDTLRLGAVHSLAFRLAYANPDSAMKLAQLEWDFAHKTNQPRWESAAYATMGTCYLNKGDFQLSYDYTLKSYDIRKRMNDAHGMAVCLNNLGIVFYQQGDYPRAIDYYQQSLRMKDSIGDRLGAAAAYSNIGMVYEDNHQPEKALQNYLASLRIRDSLNDTRGIGDSYSKLAQYYLDTKQYELARVFLEKFIVLCDSSGNRKGEANGFENLAGYWKSVGQPDSAMKFYLRALSIRQEIKDRPGICFSSGDIGDLELEKKHYQKAIDWCQKGFHLADSIGFVEGAQRTCDCLAQAYDSTGDKAHAFFYYKKSIELRDSLLNNEKSKEITKKTMQFQFERAHLADSLKHAEEDHVRQLRETEKEKQQSLYFIAGSIAFILVLLLAIVLWRGNRQTQKANFLLSQKNQIIGEKNKDITDSINYAKKIQEAIFPDPKIKYRLFPDAFVLFMPRDVVSGDFYWYGECNGKRIIAAVDCTGHGVPGAFMSMIGNAFLNEIIHEKKITTPAQILNELRERVIHALKQEEENFTEPLRESRVKDGMDIAICVFENDFSGVQFAGAYNPLWLIRGGELQEFAADKQPIGLSAIGSVPFTNHEIKLQPGDNLYIFTDGYADQFGGPMGKKFKYRQLKELLVSIRGEKMNAQEKIIGDRFAEWKGNLDQVDDVLVIGIQVR